MSDRDEPDAGPDARPDAGRSPPTAVPKAASALVDAGKGVVSRPSPTAPAPSRAADLEVIRAALARAAAGVGGQSLATPGRGFDAIGAASGGLPTARPDPTGILQVPGIKPLPTSRLVDTGGAVVAALEQLLGSSFYGGLMRSAMARPRVAGIEAMVGETLRTAGLGQWAGLAAAARAAPGLSGPGTGIMAWARERSLLATAVGRLAGAASRPGGEAAALVGTAAGRSRDGWRSVVDGVVGPALATARPGLVAGYGAIDGKLLDLAARGLPSPADVRSAGVTRQLAEQTRGFGTALGALVDPLRAVLADSRRLPPAAMAADPERAVQVALEVEEAIDAIGTIIDPAALLDLLTHILRIFVENSRREIAQMGILTAFMVAVAAYQTYVWIAAPAAAGTSAGSDAPVDGTMDDAARELHHGFVALETLLGEQESDNLEGLPRVRVIAEAAVRGGPEDEADEVARLAAGQVVAVRERGERRVLAFFRDPRSGAASSGWIATTSLEIAEDPDAHS